MLKVVEQAAWLEPDQSHLKEYLCGLAIDEQHSSQFDRAELRVMISFIFFNFRYYKQIWFQPCGLNARK
jgi:hypothetical protein